MRHAPTDRRLSSQLPSEVNLAEMGVDIAESDKDRRLPMEGQIWCVCRNVLWYGGAAIDEASHTQRRHLRQASPDFLSLW